MASERAAYPDLCTAAVEQFKLSPKFQIAIDVALERSLVREGKCGAGPSIAAAAELVEGQTKTGIIQNFEQSDYYKHEMSMYWDSGWVSCQRSLAELFLDINVTLLKPGERDIAQTPLDEGIKEKDLASSGEERDGGGDD
ncbi:hypothetical protein CsSME_00011177 [Camellia sinensis var. sinensis]